MTELTPDDIRRRQLLDRISQNNAPRSAPRNVHLVALFALSAGLGTAAAISAILGFSPNISDENFLTSCLSFAGVCFRAASITLLAGLVVGGLTWKPQAPVQAPEPSGSVTPRG